MAEQKENQFSGMTREEIILEAKKQILHSAVLALAALIVIGVACYAWFVSSSTVTAIVGSVTPDADCFELASEGTAGKYDGLVPGSIRVLGEAWPGISVSGTQTTQNKKTILWNMTSDNNLGNFSQADNGIQPGDYGTLEFYVLRKQQGDLKINCYLDIIPLDETGKELVSTTEQNTTEAGTGEAADATRVLQLLRGHLLFFSTYQISTIDSEGKQVNTTMRQLTDISDGSFQVELPAGMEEVKVTLNWYWPYFLRHAIEYYQDSTFAEKMSERVVDSLAEGNVNYFFTNDATMVYVGYARKDENDTRTVITRQNVTRYAKRLGEYYNEADQVIGDNVKGIVLRLRAEAG